ncbi:MAG TPA: hypothetical protein PLP34_06090 [Chitinophagaceae bacterium]|nr:hypothetical protein [Chitinophagaceae bacterium]
MKANYFLLPLFLFLAGMNFVSCTNNKQQKLLGDICDTTVTQFAAFVNPVITNHCLSCHNDADPQGGISLEGYTNVKDHYPKILETIKNGSMPKNGTPLDICTITKIETWVNRGAQNN